MEMSSDEDAGPSELGTKDYWDKTYELEITNFKSHGDVGEEWFGEDSAARIVRWLSGSDLVSTDSKIIDIGTGNGMLLVSLAEEGFTNLLGVDYSEHAVQLARGVINKMELAVKIEVWDLLGEIECPDSPHDVALDKGTYDAIGLSEEGPLARDNYARKIYNILKPGGLLLITSCNWTKAELEQHFTTRGFTLMTQLPTPTFKFGGKEGSLVTSLVFRRDL